MVGSWDEVPKMATMPPHSMAVHHRCCLANLDADTVEAFSGDSTHFA